MEAGRRLAPSNGVSAGIKDDNVFTKPSIILSLIKTFWVDSGHLFFTPNLLAGPYLLNWSLFQSPLQFYHTVLRFSYSPSISERSHYLQSQQPIAAKSCCIKVFGKGFWISALLQLNCLLHVLCIQWVALICSDWIILMMYLSCSESYCGAWAAWKPIIT